MTPREMEAEAALFWRLSRSLAALRIAFQGTGVQHARTSEIIDDLEVIALHSEWPLLRSRAALALAGFEARRAQA